MAKLNAQKPKGPVFYQPPKETSDDELDRIGENPNLDFNNILKGMGGSEFLSSENESEEEERKEARKPKKKSGNVKVFRPNLSAGNRFTEDSRSSSTNASILPVDDIVDKALKKQFEAHLADPNTPIQRESDSDTAPVAAIVDEREETDEERKARDHYNVDESARLASSEDEAGQKTVNIRGRPPKGGAKQPVNPVQDESSASSSSGDEQWFAAQRKNVRQAGATRPQTAASTSA